MGSSPRRTRRPMRSSAARRSSRTRPPGRPRGSPPRCSRRSRKLPEVGEAGGLRRAGRGQRRRHHRQGRQEGRPRERGRQLRRRAPAVQPAEAQDGRVAQGPAAGRRRRRHRRQAALRSSATPITVSTLGKKRHLRADRHRQVRRGRLARVRQHRGLGPEDRADGAAPRGQLRLDLDRGREGHVLHGARAGRRSRSCPARCRSRTATSRPRTTRRSSTARCRS